MQLQESSCTKERLLKVRYAVALAIVATALLLFYSNTHKAALLTKNESNAIELSEFQKKKANADHGDEADKTKALINTVNSVTPPLTEAQEKLVKEAISTIEKRFREIERANAVKTFEKHEEGMSSVYMRLPEPSVDTLSEINELANHLESQLANVPGADKRFGEGFQRLWKDYGPYRPGWPFKVVCVRVFDQDDGSQKITSIVGYTRDVASTIPEESGRLVLVDGSHPSSTIWNGVPPYGSWARERYGYLFQFDDKKK